jgi:putative ABC transport system permease protein
VTGRDLIKIILANLSRMKLRAGLTAVGVLVGTTAIVTMVSLGVGMQQSITAQMMSAFGSVKAIQVFPQVFGESGPMMAAPTKMESLTPKLIKKIERIPGVERVIPEVGLSGGLTIDGKETEVSLTGVNVDDPFDLKLDAGRWPGSNRAKMIVAPAKLPDRLAQVQPISDEPVPVLGEKAKVTLARQTEAGEEEKHLRLRVVGQLKSRSQFEDYNTVYVPMETAEGLMEWQSGQSNHINRDGYDSLRVIAATVQDVEGVEAALKDLNLGTFSVKSQLDAMRTFFLVLQAILGAIGAVALVVASIGIINTMVMSIYERTREIGIMKAVGAANSDVMKIFLGEAAAIGILGGLAGVLFGWLTAKTLGLIAGFYMQQAGAADGGILSFVVPWWLAVFALAFAAVVGVAAGIYPALRASRLNPLEALRHD